MANISAGNKRSWDGSDSTDSSSTAKRHRTKGDDPRDWRDVHLRPSPARREHHRRESPRRRRSSRERERERDRDGYRRSRDYSRDRPRRDRDHSRDRTRQDGDRSRRRDSPRKRSSSPPIPNGQVRPPRKDDEKEEGEISPPPPPLPREKERRPPKPQQQQQQRPPEPEKKKQPEPEPKPEPEMELEIPTTPPPVGDILAVRRAKRQAILAKYSGGQTSTNASPSPMTRESTEPPPPPISRGVSQPSDVPVPFEKDDAVSSSAALQTNGKRDSISRSPEPTAEFTLAKAEEEESDDSAQTGGISGHPEQARDGDDVDQMMAADYDPSLDRREDEQKRNQNVVTKNDGNQQQQQQRQPPLSEVVEEEVEEEAEEEDDMDDMFAVALGEKKPQKKVKKVLTKKVAVPALITTSNLDSAADPEGYYSVILGEQLDGARYQVFSSLGKGMFANVVRARVLQGEIGEAGKEVAIKIVRCQESMYKAGLKEIQILNKLKQADPDDKKHIVRLERTFEHRGHLCLVFESLSMNLRDVVKRFGKDVGLNIRAVRAYTHQLFLALGLLRKLNVIHADIKPDNILVNENKTLVKLCDLGSASDAAENEITPYLVSRFYRAPEIILGVPYDASLDIWSIGCTLYELYTGKILFPGRSNNQMLLLMMELKGRFNTKMIRKAKFGDVYFDDMGGFQSVEKDRVTGTDVSRTVHFSKPSRDLRAKLMPPSSAKMKEEEVKMITAFIDLLDKCLALDPARRIQPREVLNHPFIRGQF